MPRLFAVNDKLFATAARVVTSLVLVLPIVFALPSDLNAQGPALTTISDTVYRADGSGASGTALISWPSFQTASGDAVAAGNLSVTIGPLGAFTVQLAPNVGATPAGTYYVVSAYSNPYRWQRRREAFHDFRFHMETSPNVELHVVEVAFGDRPYEVTSPDNPLDLQLRTDSSLWIKECAINEGVRRFPPDWRYGGYVDGDFHFTRHDWALEAIHMLQHHSFVQLFSTYADLTGETATSHLGHRPYRMSTSFAWNYMHQTEFLSSRLARRGGTDTYYAPLPASEVFPFGHPPGATGGAWSWRRDAFDMVGGMLDTCILGSADWHQAFGLVQATNVAAEMKRCTQPYVQTVLNWQGRAAKLNRIEGRSPMGCIDNFATHAFHGSKSLRAYGERWALLQKWAFDPATDIARDYQGLWRWTGNKPGLRDDVARYFIERSEDGPMLLGETPLV
jgi:hypothetical protein